MVGIENITAILGLSVVITPRVKTRSVLMCQDMSRYILTRPLLSYNLTQIVRRLEYGKGSKKAGWAQHAGHSL